MLSGSVLEATALQETVELRLVDRVDWPKTHRNRWELPEVRHQPWVRVARKTAAWLWTGLLLAEVVHFVSGDSSLKECSCVWTRGGVALDEDRVWPLRVVVTFEEVVETNLVERCARGER